LPEKSQLVFSAQSQSPSRSDTRLSRLIQIIRKPNATAAMYPSAPNTDIPRIVGRTWWLSSIADEINNELTNSPTNTRFAADFK
jgi:hypothetical protein